MACVPLATTSQNYSEIEITVKTQTGVSMNIPCNSYDTIETIKEKVERIESQFSKQMQRLIFAGNQLLDRKTLEEYKIKDKSTLHLVLKTR